MQISWKQQGYRMFIHMRLNKRLELFTINPARCWLSTTTSWTVTHISFLIRFLMRSVCTYSAIYVLKYQRFYVYFAVLIIHRAKCRSTRTQTSAGPEDPLSCQLSLAPPAAPTNFHSLPAAPWRRRYPCGSLSLSCSLHKTIQFFMC